MIHLMFMAFLSAAAPPDLRGTQWTGTYTALGVTGPISIAFRPELGVNGELEYDFKPGFGEFPSPVARTLAYADGPCAHTPRGLRLEDDGRGMITVYECSDDEQARLPKDHQPVVRLMANDVAMVIEVRLFDLIRVEYWLHRETR